MRLTKILSFILFSLVLTSCGIMRPASTVLRESMADYKYVFILDTKELASSSGGVYGGGYGSVYGSTTTKSVNPSDIISGYLLKQGYIRVPELTPTIAKETMIVSYGESGRRVAGLGYAIEVTIQFTSATTHTLIASTTAEGQGETEADDIRKAIYRALDALFPKD